MVLGVSTVSVEIKRVERECGLSSCIGRVSCNPANYSPLHPPPLLPRKLLVDGRRVPVGDLVQDTDEPQVQGHGGQGHGSTGHAPGVCGAGGGVCGWWRRGGSPRTGG